MERRITPENIEVDDLRRDGVFVFGSNEAGVHGAGAAHFARIYLGARIGQGFGLMAQSFGIPTKDWDIQKLDINIVRFYVDRFLAFTQTPFQKTKRFMVTKIGCGLAGFTEEQIAPLFKEGLEYKNVYLPQSFIDIIESKNETYGYSRSKDEL